jgi:hypothetical protein
MTKPNGNSYKTMTITLHDFVAMAYGTAHMAESSDLPSRQQVDPIHITQFLSL